MSITTVGIIGAGTMGNGIAQACAVKGIKVVMVDISEAAVQKGLATVSGSLDRLIKKEKITQADKDAALACIQTSTSYDDLKAAQLVIEAATENYELKLKILKQVDAIVAPEVIVASNTSSISITKLAPAMCRTEVSPSFCAARRRSGSCCKVPPSFCTNCWTKSRTSSRMSNTMRLRSGMLS